MSGRILVVDDIATNRELLKAKLATSYYDVILAEDGEAALEIAAREQPDIVLLDVQMPGLDGHEVCQRLKAAPDTAHIPVVMVTAHESPEERLRGLEAGADDFLAKPINDMALFARMRSLMRMKMMFDELRWRDSTSRELGLDSFIGAMDLDSDGPGSVLIAAADRVAGDLLGTRLHQRLGVTVMVADNEHAALNLAQLEAPDAFIVHQHLGDDGDGMRLLSALRARTDTRGAAVILVVDEGDMDAAAQALDLGVSDYIMMPFDLNELAARLRSQVRRKKIADRLRSNVRDGLRLAVIDPLTGLFNRRYAMQHLGKIIDRGRATSGDVAVMMLDLDRFKSINDRYGHDAGDVVLKEFARRLLANVRGLDLVARLGGEEFFVAMPETDTVAAGLVAERVRRAVANTPVFMPDGTAIEVTVSIGIALDCGRDEEPEALIKCADRALYLSKREGRNRVSFFEAAEAA
ncbi:MAG: PleD family two-component system response regulator [Pseudomonadota bacterium]